MNSTKHLASLLVSVIALVAKETSISHLST